MVPAWGEALACPVHSPVPQPPYLLLWPPPGLLGLSGHCALLTCPVSSPTSGSWHSAEAWAEGKGRGEHSSPVKGERPLERPHSSSLSSLIWGYRLGHIRADLTRGPQTCVCVGIWQQQSMLVTQGLWHPLPQTCSERVRCPRSLLSRDVPEVRGGEGCQPSVPEPAPRVGTALDVLCRLEADCTARPGVSWRDREQDSGFI